MTWPVSQAGELETATAQRVAFPDARVAVEGLAWFAEDTPALTRLPTRLKATFPPVVWTLSVYLPIGRMLSVSEFLLQPEATVRAPKPYALPKPLVYYGSSITQGFAASNPGGTYQAVLGRWLNLDFINLGFSGNGLGEPALAQAVAEIEAACFIVDYWANPTTQVYRNTLPTFIALLRKKHPLVPIIVTGPYYNPSEEVPGEAGSRQHEKRRFTREFVAARQGAGDRFITHVDGLEMLSKDQTYGLVDGRHANSLGFYFCARGLEPQIRKVLSLAPAPKRR